MTPIWKLLAILLSPLLLCALAQPQSSTSSPASAPPTSGTATAASVPPCVPIGGCVTICFARPPLPAPGFSWTGGTGVPAAFEHDWLSANDVVGPCAGADPACIEICNIGGELFGPTSGPLTGTGSGEQDDIEVYVEWTSETVGSRTTGWTVGGSVGGGSSTGANGQISGSGGSATSAPTLVKKKVQSPRVVIEAC